MAEHSGETSHPFVDPISHRRVTLHMGTEPGVEHPDCIYRAEVSPDLDCFYCHHCGWNGRISGAWFMDLLMAEEAPTMTLHISKHGIEQDDQGFTFVTCECGVAIGPAPDEETLVDMVMEHSSAATAKGGDDLRTPLRACWDRFSDVMPDDLYEQVRSALHLLEFTAGDVSDIEEGSEFDGPTLV